MSKVTGGGGSFSAGNSSRGGGGGEEVQQQEILNHHLNSIASSTTTNNSNVSTTTQVQQPPQPTKRNRNMPGNPDPSAEVIALSPNSLVAKNRFVCQICNKGFQRDQNLQLHRRSHNLPWKLGQRTGSDIKKRAYICPEPSCVHHNPARALGDLTGIKKHFCRKHGEKKWKCDKCSKKYAVLSDWKAHLKTCGTKEYKCDCGTIFSRRDSFITHRAFCEAVAEDNSNTKGSQSLESQVSNLKFSMPISQNAPIMADLNDLDTKSPLPLPHGLAKISPKPSAGSLFSGSQTSPFGDGRSMSNCSSSFYSNTNSTMFDGNCGAGDPLTTGSASMSATVLFQKAALIGATANNINVNSPTRMAPSTFGAMFHPQNNQIQMAGGGESEFFSQIFNANGGVDSSALHDTGMFTGGFSDQNSELLKIVDQQDSLNRKSSFQGSTSSYPGLITRTSAANTSALSKFIGDVLTVDFLGIGQSRPRNLLEEQNQELRYGGIDHLGMQGSNSFEQTAAAMAKSIWDV